MAFTGTGKVWMNGKLVDWANAHIHVASHVIHYASAVFEGARCYKTPLGSAFFRLDAHIRRLIDSAKIYRMEAARSGRLHAGLSSIRCRPTDSRRATSVLCSIAATTNWASTHSRVRSRALFSCGSGAPTSAPRRSNTAWTPACRRGRAAHPTRSRPWPSRRPITPTRR